jgi:hypothetical protein
MKFEGVFVDTVLPQSFARRDVTSRGGSYLGA